MSRICLFPGGLCTGTSDGFDGNMRDRGDTEGIGTHQASANGTGVLGKLFLSQTFFETQSGSLAFVASLKLLFI